MCNYNRHINDIEIKLIPSSWDEMQYTIESVARQQNSSKSQDWKSRLSHNVGSNGRYRSKSGYRYRRNRSCDRSQFIERRRDRDLQNREYGRKSGRSKSPRYEVTDGDNYNNIQQEMVADNHKMYVEGESEESMYMQFRPPTSPPITSLATPKFFSNQRQQEPLVLGNKYDWSSDNVDKKRAKFDFRDHQGFNSNIHYRFKRLPQASATKNNYDDNHWKRNDYRGEVGTKYNNHQHKAIGSEGNQTRVDGDTVRPSRSNLIHENEKSLSFNPFQSDDGDLYNSKKLSPRFNNRNRYSQTSTWFNGYCLEINNMSKNISKIYEIKKIFEGIHISGSSIKIPKHLEGVAFVQFNNNHQKNIAMRKNGTEYKGSRLVIKHLSDEEFYKINESEAGIPIMNPEYGINNHNIKLERLMANGGEHIKQSKEQNNKQDGDNNNKIAIKQDNKDDDNDKFVVCKENVEDDGNDKLQQVTPTKYMKLKPLPVTVTKEDVQKMVVNVDDLQQMMFYPDGEFLSAAIELQSVNVAEDALKQFNSMLFGSRSVFMLRCSLKEFQLIQIAHGKDSQVHNHYPPYHPPLLFPSRPPWFPGPWFNCVYMYGLSNTVTIIDIKHFFNGIFILPHVTHIMFNKLLQPTGDVYCEFDNPQKAQVALSLNQCYIGLNLVHIELINRLHMIQIINQPYCWSNSFIYHEGN